MSRHSTTTTKIVPNGQKKGAKMVGAEDGKQVKDMETQIKFLQQEVNIQRKEENKLRVENNKLVEQMDELKKSSKVNDNKNQVLSKVKQKLK